MPSDTPHDPARTPGEGPGRQPTAVARNPPGSRGFKDELLDALSWRALLLVIGVLVLQLGFILSYIGAFHAPKPHRITPEAELVQDEVLYRGGQLF